VTISGRAAVLADGLVGPVEIEVVAGRVRAVRPVDERRTSPWTLVPGFVDLQVNGIDDIDVARAADRDWDRLDAALVRQGVTAWCPTLVSAPLDSYAAPLARIAEAARRRGPRPTILGAHLEGPFLGHRPGAHRADAVVPADLDWIEGLPSIVRLMTLGPEQPGALAAIAALRARGVTVALGHTDAEPEVLAEAVAVGACLFTHLFNASGPLAARAPGPVGAALTDDRLAVSLIADLVHVAPHNLRLALRAKPAGGVVLVTDAVAWRSASATDQGIELVEGAPRLPAGTIAGSALTMDAAVRNLMAAGGADLVTAVGAATAAPARVLGEPDRGRLAPGTRADVVALDADGRVAQVWIAGHPLL
jgi:N-acetylglucosamine-6-phosphate deacetylase